MTNENSNFDGFVATITGISLFDYLQLMLMTRKTKVILIKSQNRIGLIELESGNIVFAKSYDDKYGKEGFFEILSWDKGSFKEVYFKKRLQKNIVDSGNILLQAAEYIDNKNIETKEYSLDRESLAKEFKIKTEEQFIEGLKYDFDSNEKNNENIKLPKECEYIDSCSILHLFRSEAIKGAWLRLYCQGQKCEDCERKQLIKSGKEVPSKMLPNGTFMN